MVKLIESTILTSSRNIKAKSNNNKQLNADSNFSFLLEVFYIFGATVLRRAVAFLVSCLYKIAKIFAESERNVYF
jgi:hypothetical protein